MFSLSGEPVLSDTIKASTSGEQPDMLRAISSFKVLTECPIATVYLFQMHRNTIPTAVKSAIPLAMDVSILSSKAGIHQLKVYIQVSAITSTTTKTSAR